MPPKNIQRQPQDVTPATYAAIRPGTPVVQLNPQEEEVIHQAARQQGVNTAEAMRRVAENLPPVQQRQTVTEQSLDRLERARELGLTSDDKTDPLNQVMRYGFYKDLKKDMKRGDEDRMSTREMMEMAILQRMLPPADNGTQSGTTQFQQMMSEMKAENEKQRQFYEQRLKEQDEKIRDMIFEKRFRTMEDNQAETVNDLSQQLADVSQRMELYRNIPTNPSPEEKKDAISHLEDLGGQIERIKKALAPFGIVQPSPSSPSSSVPSVPGQDIYKKQDGSMDYFRYSVDKLESTIGKVTDAWQKKTPDRKHVAETPPPAETHQTHQTEATYRQLSPEEYADVLLDKANPTPEEQQWLNNYTAYLEKQRVKLQPKTKVQQQPYIPQTAPERQAVSEQPAATGCCICGSPEIYQDGFCEQCWNNQNRTPEQPVEEQPRKSVIDRLKEQEEDELRRTRGLL